jgi:hypothetical protein
MLPTKPKTALSRTVLDKLWDQCNWAHEVWTLRRALIDDNRRRQTLQRGPYFFFVITAGNALHEYVLQQMAKLHDPAGGRRVSLTLEFAVEYGGWDAVTLRKLKTLKSRLDALDKQIRPARNQLISHNDLGALLGDVPLGAFKAGADKRYFKTLFMFMSTAYECATGGPCAEFATLKEETERVVAALASSTLALKRRRRYRVVSVANQPQDPTRPTRRAGQRQIR